MAKVKVEVTTPGAKAAADALLKLSAAERKAALSAAGLDKQLKKTGRTSKKASGSMLKGFARVGATMTGIGSASQLIAGSVRLIRTEFERLKKIDVGAFTAQKTMKNAIANFLINNPQVSNAEASLMVDAAMEVGKQLGQGGGAKALHSMIALRGGTPGASPKDQQEALDIAIGLQSMDPGLVPETFAMNAIKIKEFAETLSDPLNRLNIDQSMRMLLDSGARAGGDVTQLAQSMVKLGGVAGPATGTGLPDLLSLFAFTTAETADPTGKTTATTIGTLLSGLQSRPLMVSLDPAKPEDKTEIVLEGASGLDKLLNLANRIKAEEFGPMGKDLLGSPEVARIMRSTTQLGGGAEAMKLLGKLISGMDKFVKTREMITRPRTESSQTIDQELKGNLVEIFPAAAAVFEEQKTEGETFEKHVGTTTAGARKQALDRVRSQRTLFEIDEWTSPKQGGMISNPMFGPGFKWGMWRQQQTEAHPLDIKKRGELELAQILADQILGKGGMLDESKIALTPGASFGRREALPWEVEARRQLRAAVKPEEIIETMARFLLVDAKDGLKHQENEALKLAGVTGSGLAHLQTADLTGGRDALVVALEQLMQAIKDETADRLATGTGTGAATPPVEIESNESP